MTEKRYIGRSWKWSPEEQRMIEILPDAPKDVDAPFVQQDTIEPTMSMTGSDRIYESKSALRREYKELGFVETGAPPKKENCAPRKYKPDIASIRDTALEMERQLKWGMAPLTERERHERVCGSEEERRYKAWKERNWKD